MPEPAKKEDASARGVTEMAYFAFEEEEGAWLPGEADAPKETAPLHRGVTEMSYVTFDDEDFSKVKSERAAQASEEPEAADTEPFEERELLKKDIEINEAWEDAETIREEAREDAEALRVQAQENAEAMREEAAQEAATIIEKARNEAEQILKTASGRANDMEAAAKVAGRERGYEDGLLQGKQDGEAQWLRTVSEKHEDFFAAVDAARGKLEEGKQEALLRYLDDLSELTLTIAEKIVRVSLASSAEVIKRMIVFAAEPAAEKQWAKVTISGQDAERMKKDKVNIKKALREISDRIELVIKADAPTGTCLVEFPDQVVDAGAETQLKNMQEIIEKSAKE